MKGPTTVAVALKEVLPYGLFHFYQMSAKRHYHMVCLEPELRAPSFGSQRNSIMLKGANYISRERELGD